MENLYPQAHRHSPESDLEHVEENAGRYSLGFGAQNIGDQIVSAKTVLPWFLGLVAAPAWVLPLLVPIRESGSMLPQAALRPWIQARTRRLPLLLLGSAGQALACFFMAYRNLRVRRSRGHPHLGVLGDALLMSRIGLPHE